ncbi:MAG: phosphodiester glycosidase family protein [Candidatus Saganbacteria bacterium]|nr:phosphodiester glycosidase family protein [Candidatus Saganbacteria bacterium]
MKKIIAASLLCLTLAAAGQATKLANIRLGYYPDKLRAVFDFDSSCYYMLEESREKIIIHLPSTAASAEIQNYVEVRDLVVRYFEIEKEGEGLAVTIPLAEPVPYNIYTLTGPDRLVVDFNRNFTNVVSGGTIIDGVEHLIVSRGSESGRVNAHVLKIDLGKAEVSPALARKNKPNLFESFVNLLNFWKKNDPDAHFFRAPVSTIAGEQQAVAAVNGTYFAYTGKPLGTLLIDRELVSSPIYDRTALILSEDHKPYIDNILINCYFTTASGITCQIDGVNEGRDTGEAVLYTPAWGGVTGTEFDGSELVVAGSVVKEIKKGNAAIPQDGYVISLGSEPARRLAGARPGDKIDLHIKIIPYACDPGPIRHLISGGPRLVKEGIVYVSKNEEKFRSDIASGRAARTAVGVAKDGQLLLVTVDGLPRERSARGEKSSIGVTLEELAELMINLGAVEAMNLDGGGSTAMWIDGRIVNQPASGCEQKVSNALVVTPR